MGAISGTLTICSGTSTSITASSSAASPVFKWYDANNGGNLLYTGAIDDWVQALGKKRVKASKNYLLDAIEQTLRAEGVTIRKTKAFGCKINDY